MTEPGPPLVILYEDPHCLAVAKPAGLLTQGRADGAPTHEEAVRRHLDPGAPDAVYLGTVHRLDRPVSGVVLWAKTPKAARRLAAQFSGREARKEYWAIVAAGEVAPLWEDGLLPVSETGTAPVVAVETPGARRAVTRALRGRAVRLPDGCAWLRLWPETGRTHQLRAQAAARGLAIVGDTTYGSTRPFADGIALHARSLSVRHPVTRQALTLVAPLPSSWGALGIELPETLPPGG